MDYAALHERARQKGANPIVYWSARAVLQPFFHIYFRMSRIGREHIPAHGPVIVAANHRSFLDPFVIGTMARRPMYYVAKQELFANRLLAWMLNALGAFPVDRGAADLDSITTAKRLLERGEIVLIFVEGTRVRPGSLGRPRKGVGRLALETGAPVVPVAVIGTEAIRRGWRIRPHKVRIRAGAPLRFPHAPNASPQLASAVTARIWPCVMLQWEWLGGLPQIRRAAIIGAGCRGTRLAVCLARAGFEVDLGCRTPEQAAAVSAGAVNERYLPGVELPAKVTVLPARGIELAGHDLVCLAVPPCALADVLASYGERITRRSAVLVLCDGLLGPDGTLPSAYVEQRTDARAVGVLGGPAHGADLLHPGARVIVASRELAYAGQLAQVLRAAGLHVRTSQDVTGVELAGCAGRVAACAAAEAAPAGPDCAVAAAEMVSAEVRAFASARGAARETFAALPAGLQEGFAALPAGLQEGADGRSEIEIVSLLAGAIAQAGIEARALDDLLALLEGRLERGEWIETVLDGPAERRSRGNRAA